MNLVVFGLTISSSWGNGHATLWRGLGRALAQRGCTTTFFERNRSYYATTRDFHGDDRIRLVMYESWEDVCEEAATAVAEADVVIVTSYCPDGIAAAELPMRGTGQRVFYDLDTPVTLDTLRRGERTDYMAPSKLWQFDLVLSFTGGAALAELASLGARRVARLHGFVDPDVHRPVARDKKFECAMGFIGTYAQDRQAALAALLIEPARRLPDAKFMIAGSLYPPGFPWRPNIHYVHHLPPADHAAFLCSSRVTLNVTRGVMKRMGWCPSGRLFEAAACGVPIVSDRFEGLEWFLTPGAEVLVAEGPEEAVAALELTDAELARIGAAGRERVLAEHTADRRAAELLSALQTGDGDKAPDCDGAAEGRAGSELQSRVEA